MKLPAFSLPASDGQTYTDQDWAHKKIVLYLYPKDMTPGCTLEAHDFQKNMTDFAALGFQVFGLSKDSVASHEKFCAKDSLSFPLLSDESTDFIAALGSWVEKSMYGKKYQGIDRSTFIIVDGEIVQAWHNVKVPGHVETVMEYCRGI